MQLHLKEVENNFPAVTPESGEEKEGQSGRTSDREFPEATGGIFMVRLLDLRDVWVSASMEALFVE